MVHVYSVDVGYSAEADNHHERLSLEVDLCRFLHNDPVHPEIRATYEFGVWQSAVVRRAIFRIHVVVDGIFRLLNVQFARLSVGIFPPEVVNAVRYV